MDYGILYVATGTRFCEEAIVNSSRVRLFNPSISISIKTDQIELAKRSNLFDNIIPFTEPCFSYKDKITGLVDLPYKKTLFLDTDACLIRDFGDFLPILDIADLAAAYAPVRHPPGWTDLSASPLFPELNTGVLLVRRSPELSAAIDAWLRLYDKLLESHSQSWDQASFRSILWSAVSSQNIRFLHLPSEVNLRTTKPWIAGRGMPVYVIHGRFPVEEFSHFVNYLNSDIDRFRTWTEWLSLFPDSGIKPRFDRTFG